MADEEYLTRLDSLARFYNAEFLTHIGYELTLSSLAVASLLATANLMLGPFVGYLTNPNASPPTLVGWAAILAVGLLWVFFLILVVMWFLTRMRGPRFPYSFEYLFARSQYYAVLSEIIWEHMGVSQTPTVRNMLRRRVARLKSGERDAVKKLFEARLYVSNYRIRISKGRREDESAVKKNLVDYFEIVDKEIDKIVDPKSDHYNKPLTRWNRADLLTLAYEPTLRDYDYKVSGNQALDMIAKLIRDC